MSDSPSRAGKPQAGVIHAKWGALGEEEYAVLIVAHEEGLLTQVLASWRARQLWTETGTTLTPSDLTDEDKRRLVPRFAEIVLALVDQGWIELTEYLEQPDKTVPLSGGALQSAVSDWRSWIWNEDMTFRVVHVNATESWDELK